MALKTTQNKLVPVWGLLFAAWQIVGCAALEENRVSEPPGQDLGQVQIPAAQPDLEAYWGIRIVSLRRTAAGHLLDFRFRVNDPEKAVALLRRQANAYLIDQTSGKKLAVPRMPKVGALRTSAVKPEAGRIYFILFNNTGDLVQPGTRVTIVIGDFKAEHLVVE